MARPATMPFVEARGAWLAFLDQDDIWMPRKLEMQMALKFPPWRKKRLGGRPAHGIIYGRTVRFYPSGTGARLRPGARVYAAAGRRHLHSIVYHGMFHRHEFRCLSPLGDRGDWRHTGSDRDYSGLLPLHRRGATVSSPGLAGGGLPLPDAWREHVAVDRNRHATRSVVAGGPLGRFA